MSSLYLSLLSLSNSIQHSSICSSNPLFQHLSSLPSPSADELSYLCFCRNKFQLNLLASLLTLPTLVTVWLFFEERSKRVNRDLKKLNRRWAVMLGVGGTAANVFLMSSYLNYFAKN
jgi:hypothetical protein